MNCQLGLVLTLLLALFHGGAAFRGGVPVSECEGMNPSHGSANPQPGLPPVDVTFKPSCHTPGVALNVTLRSSSTFKGLILQLRRQGTSQIVDGLFENFDKNLFKLMNCPPGSKNSVTHSSKAKKTELKVTWTSKAQENVEVVYTYLESFDKYWVKQVKRVNRC